MFFVCWGWYTKIILSIGHKKISLIYISSTLVWTVSRQMVVCLVHTMALAYYLHYLLKFNTITLRLLLSTPKIQTIWWKQVFNRTQISSRIHNGASRRHTLEKSVWSEESRVGSFQAKYMKSHPFLSLSTPPPPSAPHWFQSWSKFGTVGLCEKAFPPGDQGSV